MKDAQLSGEITGRFGLLTGLPRQRFIPFVRQRANACENLGAKQQVHYSHIPTVPLFVGYELLLQLLHVSMILFLHSFHISPALLIQLLGPFLVG